MSNVADLVLSEVKDYDPKDFVVCRLHHDHIEKGLPHRGITLEAAVFLSRLAETPGRDDFSKEERGLIDELKKDIWHSVFDYAGELISVSQYARDARYDLLRQRWLRLIPQEGQKFADEATLVPHLGHIT